MKLKMSDVARFIIKARELLIGFCLAMCAGWGWAGILPTLRKTDAYTNQHLKTYCCRVFFLLTSVSMRPSPGAVKNAVYSLAAPGMVMYLFSLLKLGQREMDQIPLHYPCSTSSAARSCDEITAFDGVHPKAHR